MFLTETDTKNLRKEEDYTVKGYCTYFPERHNNESKIRIICLINEAMSNQVKIRRDLMSKDFPSIWVEHTIPNKKPTLFMGFYRQWTHLNLSKEEAESNGIAILTEQIFKASTEIKNKVLMGDVSYGEFGDMYEYRNKS